jgi:predicted metal-dependent HD superfamily phosphohydrolase
MEFQKLIVLVQAFVEKLLNEKLNPQLCFHNSNHTKFVVAATKAIGFEVGLSPKEQETVTIAAWFHDTGYTEAYQDHERVSFKIATQFLSGLGISKDQLAEINSCILATRFPQNPKNLMEMVICDADFYHLSVDKYQVFALALKKEWEAVLGLIYTQSQWDSINLEMLSTHNYFTSYGQSVLEANKTKNIAKLK